MVTIFVSLREGTIRPLACHPVVGLLPAETPLGLNFGGRNLPFPGHPVQFTAGELLRPDRLIKDCHHHCSIREA